MKYYAKLNVLLALLICSTNLAVADVDQETLDSISTPDTLETSIGTLNFIDGAPMPETAETVYDFLDRSRGVDAFLKGMPAASVHMLIEGAHSQGAVEAHQVIITEKLLDANSLFLTGNSSTMYVIPDLDLERDGPTVLEAPAGALGAINDAYFRYIGDIGPAGPDKGEGGKYLILPPGYEGDVPSEYFVVKSPSYRVWIFMRMNVSDGLDAAYKNVTDNLKIYPLSKADNPPELELIEVSGNSFNTIHANDFNFYNELNAVVQKEPLSFLDSETRGLFASIGIEKGKPFAPDERMKNILIDAVAIGNAAARSIVWYPREDVNLEGVRPYDDQNWVLGFVDRNVFFNGEDGMTMNTDARVTFHYPYTAVTPAMATPREGSGSDYVIAYVDSEGSPFDGSKTYKVNLPPDVPVNNFWSFTVYDTQTRSMLQTGQKLPAIDSIQNNPEPNADGSMDIYFSAEAPKGFEENWVQTISDKSFFVILRMYGPLKPWLDQTWRPSDVMLVE
ncbi:MAG: DUF1254 domain-containing protein [Tateyamaria sp.]|jgi:hypothetical protein|nr:DUF1254 domain-containing protein [Tateyamaria sp.]